MLLFFHNSYFYLNGSVKKKNVPRSPGLPYIIDYGKCYSPASEGNIVAISILNRLLKLY
jgi:hypothetical protein